MNLLDNTCTTQQTQNIMVRHELKPEKNSLKPKSRDF